MKNKTSDTEQKPDESKKEIRRQINRRYYERNKELIIEYRRLRYDAEVQAARYKRWYERNREKILERKREKYRYGKDN